MNKGILEIFYNYFQNNNFQDIKYISLIRLLNYMKFDLNEFSYLERDYAEKHFKHGKFIIIKTDNMVSSEMKLPILEYNNIYKNVCFDNTTWNITLSLINRYDIENFKKFTNNVITYNSEYYEKYGHIKKYKEIYNSINNIYHFLIGHSLRKEKLQNILNE